MNKFNDYFSIKKDTIGKPTTHLGTNTRQRKDSQENFEFWNLGSKSYLKETLRVVKDILDDPGVRVGEKGKLPYSSLVFKPSIQAFSVSQSSIG